MNGCVCIALGMAAQSPFLICAGVPAPLRAGLPRAAAPLSALLSRVTIRKKEQGTMAPARACAAPRASRDGSRRRLARVLRAVPRAGSSSRLARAHIRPHGGAAVASASSCAPSKTALRRRPTPRPRGAEGAGIDSPHLFALPRRPRPEVSDLIHARCASGRGFVDALKNVRHV